MTTAAPVVAVQGEAVVRATAELARLDVHIHAAETDRGAALRRMGELHERTRTALAPFAPGASTRSGGVSVHLERSTSPPRRPDRYVAATALSVDVVDPALLPGIVDALAGLDGVGFHGPSWELRPDSDAHRRVRTAALHDAVRRAQQYAAALGCELAGLLEVAEGPPEGVAGGDVPLSLAACAGPGVPERGLAERLDLAPVQLVLRALVRARFRTTVPDLGAVLARPPSS